MNTQRILKSMRIKKGYTQDDFANIKNISRQAYNGYENNPLSCPLDLLFDIVNSLEGNIEEFLNALKQDYLSCKLSNLKEKKE